MSDGELAAFIEDHDDRSEDELRRFLRKKGYEKNRVDQAFKEADKTVPVYAWILTGIITVFLAWAQLTFYELLWLTICTAYCSVFTYWLLRRGTNQPLKMAKRLLFPTILLLIIAAVIQILISRLTLAAPTATFLGPSASTVFVSIAIFFVLPVILTWLDSPSTPGFNTHPLTTLIYVVLFNVVYYVYWFYVLKSNLDNGDEIASLWLFLIPLVGPLIIYYSTADHLSDHTRHSFTTWFAVFFFLQGIDLSVAQYPLAGSTFGTE